MVVFVADQNALARPAHTMLFVVLFKSLQPCKHRRILFRLAILCAERVVTERVEAYGLGLVRVEVLGKDGAASIVSEFEMGAMQRGTDLKELWEASAVMVDIARAVGMFCRLSSR